MKEETAITNIPMNNMVVDFFNVAKLSVQPDAIVCNDDRHLFRLNLNELNIYWLLKRDAFE